MADWEFADGESVALCVERDCWQYDRVGRFVLFDGTHGANESHVEGTASYGDHFVFGVGGPHVDCGVLERVVLARVLVDSIDDRSIFFHHVVLSLLYPLCTGCDYGVLEQADAENRVLDRSLSESR